MRLAVPLVRAVATSASGSAAASLKVGDALRSDRRRFTEDDVAAYAAVSSFQNSVHLGDTVASRAGVFARCARPGGGSRMIARIPLPRPRRLPLRTERIAFPFLSVNPPNTM